MSNQLSIAGDLGSGKSTICRMFEKDGYRLYSMGAIMRGMAAAVGMSIEEFNVYAKGRREIDDEIDDHLRALAHVDEPLIADSRMAWHFLPNSVKLYLTVDPLEAARRVVQDETRRVGAEAYASPEEARAGLSVRKAAENTRYRALYGVDCADLFNYDIVADTTAASPAQVYEVLTRAIAGREGPLAFINPGRIFPTAPLCAPADCRQPLIVQPMGEHFVALGDHSALAFALQKGAPFVRCRLSRELCEDWVRAFPR